MHYFFECIELLSINKDNDFLGEAFNYRSRSNITFRGRLTGNNTRQIWSGGVSGLSLFQDYEPITINGVQFNGKLVSIEGQGGRDVLKKPTTLTIETREDGYMGNFTGSTYAGTNISISNLKYANAIDESFSFSRQGEEYTYNRNISVEIENVSGITPLAVGKNLISGFTVDSPEWMLLNSTYPNYYKSGSSTFNESYDLKRNSYSVDESFIFNATGQPYALSSRANLQLSNNGTVTAREAGNIRSLDGAPVSGHLNTVTGGIYNRLNTAYVSYMSNFYGSTGCNLNTELISRGVVNNQCNLTIDYDLEYSNDDAYLSGVKHSYSMDVSYNEDRTYDITEQGSIVVNKSVSGNMSVNDLLNYYDNIVPNISGRAYDAYSRLLTLRNASCSGSGLFLVSDSRTFSDYSKFLNYNNTYKVDRNWLEGNDDYWWGFVSTQIKPSTHIVNTFQVPHQPYEIAQGLNTSDLETIQYTVELRGRNARLRQSDYLEKAKEFIVTPNKPNIYIADAQYNFAPLDKNFKLSVTFAYTNYREKDNLRI